MATFSACESPETGEPRPWNDAWRLELDAPFPATGVQSVTIGGPLTDDNFANRGHVIVRFDPDPNASRIRVEVRRYAMATSDVEAAEVFASLKLWAARGSLVPIPDPQNSCVTAWQDGCEIRVVYDGLTQIARSGADLRVTLPSSYRHLIDIRTGDNVAESSYLRRGEVCVEGLHASVDIELGSGRAFVILDPTTSPSPTCEVMPGAVEACSATETPWGPDCPCVMANQPFGRVRVSTLDDAAANVVVDVPQALWTNISLVNLGMSQERGTDPACVDMSPPGTRCDACAPLAGYVLDSYLGSEETRMPWINRGVAQSPGSVGNASGGFLVSLESSGCAPIAFTPDPNAFVGIDGPEEQASEERGNLTVCNDCLRLQTCDELLFDP